MRKRFVFVRMIAVSELLLHEAKRAIRDEVVSVAAVSSESDTLSILANDGAWIVSWRV